MAIHRAPVLASLVLLLALLPTLVAPGSMAQPATHVVISEVLYDAPQSGTDTSYEWIETQYTMPPGSQHTVDSRQRTVISVR